MGNRIRFVGCFSSSSNDIGRKICFHFSLFFPLLSENIFPPTLTCGNTLEENRRRLSWASHPMAVLLYFYIWREENELKDLCRGTVKTTFVGWFTVSTLHMHAHMQEHERNHFATPVEVKLEATRTLQCAQSTKRKRSENHKKIPVREKSMRRRKIFAFEPLFPSHSVSRFSALSFCEREFFYGKVKKTENSISGFKSWWKVCRNSK